MKDGILKGLPFFLFKIKKIARLRETVNLVRFNELDLNVNNLNLFTIHPDRFIRT